MTAYLDLPGFTSRSFMPSDDITLLESVKPGFIEARIAVRQSKLDSRLRKRYAVPFATPVPEIVLGWLTAMVTWDAYMARGFNPEDQTISQIKADFDEADKDVREAADSKDGLFDLPLRESDQTSGVSAGTPLSYSETSPYVGFDQQACTGHSEDANGR